MTPIPMILHCPFCGTQHIDEADPKTTWSNPPHRSHLCAKCGHVWRPADVPTEGVRQIQTRGKRDSLKPRKLAVVPVGDILTVEAVRDRVYVRCLTDSCAEMLVKSLNSAKS